MPSKTPKFGARLRWAALALAAAGAALASGAGAHPLPGAPRCAVFPADNAFNQRVDRLPVAPGSARFISAIGLDAPVHPDFGAGLYDGAPIGIPITIVSRSTRRVAVHFHYASESDRGPYPIPRHVRIEGGRHATGDRHVLLVDRDSCRDYELFAAYPALGGAWRAGSGAIFNLRSDRLRPAGWTSADAAGLPILPGLARYDEVRAGSIDHALRFTAPCTAARYVYPARHDAPRCAGADAPPMGLRVRLKAERRHRQAAAPGADRRRSAQALRDDPGRQRLAVVHLGRSQTRAGATTRCISSTSSTAAISRSWTRAHCRIPLKSVWRPGTRRGGRISLPSRLYRG